MVFAQAIAQALATIGKVAILNASSVPITTFNSVMTRTSALSLGWLVSCKSVVAVGSALALRRSSRYALAPMSPWVLALP